MSMVKDLTQSNRIQCKLQIMQYIYILYCDIMIKKWTNYYTINYKNPSPVLAQYHTACLVLWRAGQSSDAGKKKTNSPAGDARCRPLFGDFLSFTGRTGLGFLVVTFTCIFIIIIMISVGIMDWLMIIFFRRGALLVLGLLLTRSFCLGHWLLLFPRWIIRSNTAREAMYQASTW